VARFANVTMTACLNRSSAAMDTSFPATQNESQALEQQKTFSAAEGGSAIQKSGNSVHSVSDGTNAPPPFIFARLSSRQPATTKTHSH
jgi:hypothetical protein